MQKQQVIIYTRKSQPPVSEKIKQSLLRGIIACGYCGHSLMVFGSEYRCQTNSNEACRGVAIPIDNIDTAVWDEIIRQLGERRTMAYISDEQPGEQKRQVLKMLGVTVILYKENDPAHSRYEIKQLVTL